MPMPFQELILIPGLLEPRFTFFPLKRSLYRQGEQVRCWHDRLVFRSLDNSVDRLLEAIAGDPDKLGEIALVTHSFGDWIAREALAKSAGHRVTAMVSLAPVMRAGFLPSLLYGVTGNLIPEIRVIMNRELAASHLDCGQVARRLVVWSRFDESLRAIPLDHLSHVQVQRVWATHISIVWQPNVIRLVNDFLSR
jgi:pimeloyl-ACP methyl ester carboxylesterase